MTAAPSISDDGEAAVRAVEAAYDAAWHARDMDGLLACFTEDAVLINPRGGTARGHEEIRRELESVLSGPARGSKHTSTVLRVQLITGDVALVDGEAWIEGGERGEPAFTFAHRFTDILVKRNGAWLIAHVRACPASPATQG